MVARGANYLGYPILKDGVMYWQGGATSYPGLLPRPSWTATPQSRTGTWPWAPAWKGLPFRWSSSTGCTRTAGTRESETTLGQDRPPRGQAHQEGAAGWLHKPHFLPLCLAEEYGGDDIHLHCTELLRSRSIPKILILHQFWEGEHGKRKFLLRKCKEIHHDWEHIVWTRDLMRARFPSSEAATQTLPVDGRTGRL